MYNKAPQLSLITPPCALALPPRIGEKSNGGTANPISQLGLRHVVEIPSHIPSIYYTSAVLQNLVRLASELTHSNSNSLHVAMTDTNVHTLHAGFVGCFSRVSVELCA